jgi:hypothetical protein
MKVIAVAAAALTILAACVSSPEPATRVRDTTGQGRTLNDYQNDVAACDYEVSMATAGQGYRPAPYGDVTTRDLRGAGRAMENLGAASIGPNTEVLWQKCMRAKGWAPA